MEKTERNIAQDWDLSDEYYQADPQSEKLSLADFIETDHKEQKKTESDRSEEAGNSGFESGRNQVQDELHRIAQLVRQVTEQSVGGRTAASIAEELHLSEQYVKDILVCVQAFPEDNPMAVARLMMG